MRTKIILLAFLFANPWIDIHAQTFSDKVVGENNAEISDSIKNSEYPYILPILGKKTTKAGFDLPYSAGLGLNYFWQRSAIIIDNLQIGFNNGPKTNLDEIIKFNDATSETNGINFRPDIYLFPFLNIYGIIGKSKSSTEINASLRISDSIPTVNFSTTAEFTGTTVGFGLTPTIGVAGAWLAVDMNFTWSDIDALEKPVYAFILDPRIGKAFKFKKQRAMAIWVGGFRIKLDSGTDGSLSLDELFSAEEINAKVDESMAAIATGQQQADDWWNSLTPPQQNNPVNIARYDAANRVLDGASTLVAGLSDAATNLSNSSVQYSLDKKQKDLWNFLLGAQYQFNKHFMVRGEYGFLSERNTFLLGLQYRFGL
jgi:opacity protein-like surface antigen